MNDERSAELQEKYKDRNLLEELAWGVYANHSGYTSKQNGEFLNWLCLRAYKALKERPKGEWITTGEEQGALGIIYKIRKCSKCGWEHSLVIPDNYCPNCGADIRGDRK